MNENFYSLTHGTVRHIHTNERTLGVPFKEDNLGCVFDNNP